MHAVRILLVSALLASSAFAADTPPWPLHAAVKANDLAALKQALSSTTDINAREDSGDQATALYLAAEAGRVELVRLLLDKGANPDAGGSLGRTPLMKASSHGHLAVMELLVAKGASIECAGHEAGWTCLKSAAYAQQLEAVKWLIDKGANVNARGDDGDNALADASLRPGNAAVVRYLLDHGADFRTPNKHGFSVMWRAEASKDAEIIKLIQDRLDGRVTSPTVATNSTPAASTPPARNAPEVMAYSCDIMNASIEMVLGTLEQVRKGQQFPCKYMESIGKSLLTTRKQMMHAAANERCDVKQDDADAYADSSFDEAVEDGLKSCSN